MNKFLLSIALSLSTLLSFAQTRDGDIQIQKAFGGVKFQQYGKTLKPNEVLAIMKIHPEAYTEFKKSNANYTAATVFGFAGGFLIGWPLGTAITGGKPEWGLAAGGVGLLLLSIPFNVGFTSHAKSAVEIYNHGSPTSSARPYSLLLVPHGTGAKLILKF